MYAASAVQTQVAQTQEVFTLDDEPVPVKQGDPHWHRKTLAERYAAKLQVRQQLQAQAEAKQREEALRAWRQDPNVDRMAMEDLVATATPLGHARLALAIRGALRQRGYQLAL